jgi:hypothetical protein
VSAALLKPYLVAAAAVVGAGAAVSETTPAAAVTKPSLADVREADVAAAVRRGFVAVLAAVIEAFGAAATADGAECSLVAVAAPATAAAGALLHSVLALLEQGLLLGGCRKQSKERSGGQPMALKVVLCLHVGVAGTEPSRYRD